MYTRVLPAVYFSQGQNFKRETSKLPFYNTQNNGHHVNGIIKYENYIYSGIIHNKFVSSDKCMCVCV